MVHNLLTNGIMPYQRSNVNGRVQTIYAMKKILKIGSGAAAVAGYNGGYAIINIIIGCGPLKNAAFYMSMHINKTRRNDHFVGIDGFGSGITCEFSYCYYFTILYSYLSIEPGVARAIDDAAIFDEYVAG